MERIQKLLTQREMVARRALTRIAAAHDWELHCMPKFTDVIEVRDSGIDDDDFDYATRAHVDFLLTDRESNPKLIIEVDACALDGIALTRAKRKDRLAHQFQMPLLRISVHPLPIEETEVCVERVTSEWLKDKPLDTSKHQNRNVFATRKHAFSRLVKAPTASSQ